MLTDDDKKSAYERYGADGPQVEHHHRGPRRGHHGDFYDDDINPEDIFYNNGLSCGSIRKKSFDDFFLLLNKSGLIWE